MAEPTPEDIKAGYGFVALLGNAVPEINSILQQAIQGKWTPDRFVMSVANTNWWRTTPDATRQWVIQSATDPASVEKQLLVGSDKIRRLSQEMGLALPDIEQARKLWLHGHLLGLGDEELKASIARSLAGGTGGGDMGRMVNEMFKMASDYGYSSGDLSGEILATARGFLGNSGTADITGWQSKMIEYAQSKFAPYAEDIRGGKTVADIARPIVDRVANLLEMNPDALDFNDPLLKKALTEWGAENRAYSLNEIENFARQDSRWKTTDNAMESSVKLLTEIGKTFGVLGGGR